MEWKRFTIHTTGDAEELVTDMLAGLGIEGVEIKDKRPVSPEESGGLFGDVVPDLPPDDHLAEISFYTDADIPSGETKAKVAAGLEELKKFADLGECRIEESRTCEEDWINNWKEYFHSFRVDDIEIRPTWEENTGGDEDVSMVLRIDPGTAFGTGAHESTQLAIRALRKYIRPGDRFLDVGTGSGILGIIALKSGASHVFGTDLDPNTLPAIEDNLRQNAISDENFTRILGDITDDSNVQEAAGFEQYDIAAANIIAEILAEITPQIPKHLKKGGIYITSGILQDREEIVLAAARKAGLTHIETEHMGEWSGMVFKKGAVKI